MTFDPSEKPVQIGVIGLGRGFVLMLPAFRSDPRIRLVAACAPRQESRNAFLAEFGGKVYGDFQQFCADPDIEIAYVATPHQMHRDHVIALAEAGKHVLVDKPIAVSVRDGLEMVRACRQNSTHLIVGPSHSFDGPVGLARQLVGSGEFGRVRMIHALNYTDFLYRPRRPEELDTSKGGGVVFSQGVHQIDIVRLLAGGKTVSVTATTGNWDRDRPTEGAYAALVSFESGAFASLTYSGYAHFDSDEWMGWKGELGNAKDPSSYGDARCQLKAVGNARQEARLKSLRTYGGGNEPPAAVTHEHFGPIIISCDKADLRLAPDGVHIYGDEARQFVEAPFEYSRREVVDAIVGALRKGTVPVQTGAWGLASLEVCHAILASARTGKTIRPKYQIGLEEAVNE